MEQGYRGQQGRVPDPGVLPPCLFQGSERFGTHRGPVFVPGLLMFPTPPDDATFKVNVRPSKLPDGTDAVSRLVRDDQSHTKAPVHLQRHFQQGLVFQLGEQHPGRVLLRGRLQASERVRLEEELTLLVPRLRGPVEDREQEPQVPFDRPVRHRLAAAAGSARTPLPDESIPVPLGQRGGISILAEELEEHLYRGPVVPPGPLTLDGGYLFTVDVKKRLQGEWLGLGLCRVLGLRRLARNGATVEGFAKRTGDPEDHEPIDQCE